jgi:hypothetical protein
MTDWLTRLRHKPKHVRNNLALVTAGACTLPVMLFLVLGVHAPAVRTELSETEKTDRTALFETFTDQIKEQMAAVRSAVSSTSSATSSPPQQPMIAVPVDQLNATPFVPENMPVGATSTRMSTSSGATSSAARSSVTPEGVLY